MPHSIFGLAVAIHAVISEISTPKAAVTELNRHHAPCRIPKSNTFQNQSIGSKQGSFRMTDDMMIMHIAVCYPPVTQVSIETYPNVLGSSSVVMPSRSDLIFGALLRDFASISGFGVGK